jgi:hypothetical protein
MKHCNKCNTNLPITEFYRDKTQKDGRMSKCRDCTKMNAKTYYSIYPEKRVARDLKYNSSHREEQKEYSKQYSKSNPDYNKQYCNKNRKARNEYHRDWKFEKYHNDELFKLRTVISSRINAHLKGKTKSKSTIEHLGCDIKFYKEYLTNMFSEDMSWDNYGTHWEIDHITPLAKGGALHYTNTQPLTVFENRSKGARIIN